jgi:hypothetical protein
VVIHRLVVGTRLAAPECMLRVGLFTCVIAMTACGASSDEPQQFLPPPPQPSFTLLVSNQSFDLDPVDITVRLDDQLAVAGDFQVEGQHTWIPFELGVTPGTHTLSAVTAAGDVELSMPFTMDDRKWGVLMFWYYEAGSPEPTPPQFTFQVLDEQPQFD